jgi:hypothetical protein
MLRCDPHFCWLAVVVTVALGTAPLTARAQEATPAATDVDTVTVIASDLVNPRSFTWGADGTLYVAIAGAGGLDTASGTPVAAPPAGAEEIIEEVAEEATLDSGTPVIEGVAASLTAANDAAVVRIEGGCPVAVAAGLPSSGLPALNWAVGVTGLTILDDELYVLVDGGGEAGLHPDEPNGVYRILADGAVELVADLSAWFRANPTEHLWGEVSPDGEPYGLAVGEGMLWISESNQEQILTVTPGGMITRVADLSPLGDIVPTGIALAPEGWVYVGFLTALPWPDGAAKIVHVAADGMVSDVWTGLTAVTSIALGPDGTLYATEMSTGNTDQEPYYRPNAGMVVRQTGPDSHEEVATGLNYPLHLGFGPDGGLYVASPAIGANGGEGIILRLDPAAAPISLADMEMPKALC